MTSDCCVQLDKFPLLAGCTPLNILNGSSHLFDQLFTRHGVSRWGSQLPRLYAVEGFRCRWRLPLTRLPRNSKHLPFKSRSATTCARGLLGCLLLAYTLTKATISNTARARMAYFVHRACGFRIVATELYGPERWSFR